MILTCFSQVLLEAIIPVDVSHSHVIPRIMQLSRRALVLFAVAATGKQFIRVRIRWVRSSCILKMTTERLQEDHTGASTST